MDVMTTLIQIFLVLLQEVTKKRMKMFIDNLVNKMQLHSAPQTERIPTKIVADLSIVVTDVMLVVLLVDA